MLLSKATYSAFRLYIFLSVCVTLLHYYIKANEDPSNTKNYNNLNLYFLSNRYA